MFVAINIYAMYILLLCVPTLPICIFYRINICYFLQNLNKCEPYSHVRIAYNKNLVVNIY